jgi:DNA-binding MarR family transcriptional regulator
MTKDTKLLPYLPFPRFLLEADLALATKLVYAVLLDRSRLSQVNGWADSSGQIYIVFPIVEIANTIDRSPMTVKNSLNELEAAGLIERQRRGQSLPNRIYIKIPDGQDIVRLTDKKLSVRGKENCPSDGQKTIPLMDRKLSTNKLTSNIRKLTEGRESACARARGRYQNVFLSDMEIAELQTELPNLWQQYVEKLSEYMASTGKTYKNHAATIRRWAAEDRRKGKTIPDYTYKEGESL